MLSLPFNFKFSGRKKKKTVNSSTSTHRALDRLPYEIFRQIILEAEDSRYSFFRMISIETILPPITASHVCRSWRAALLSDPTWWTCLNIPQMKPGQIKEMLRRSAHVPLIVFIDTGDYDFDASLRQSKVYQNQVLPSVFKEMNRLKGLRVDFSLQKHKSFKALAKRVLELLDQPAPAPILQEFYLRIGGSHRTELYESKKNAMRNLFSGDAPNLTHVYRQVLDDFRYPTPPPYFRNLHSLRLELNEGVVIRCDTLLDVLESSPSLDTLQISAFYEEPTFVSPASSDTRLVSLLHLEYLSLSFNDVDIPNFVFGHLVFPQKVNYRIKCNDFHRKISRTPLLLRFITQQRSNELDLTFFRLGYVSLTLEHQRHPGSYKNAFSMDKDDIDFQAEDSLYNLLRTFRLSNITCLTLYFADESTNTPENLINTFPLLINLQSLEIQYIFRNAECRTIITASVLTLISFPPYACWVRDDGPSEEEVMDALLNPRCPNCPLLRTLSIDVRQDWSKLDKTYATVLKACSRFRRRAGYPLDAITIRCPKSSLTEAAAATLTPRRSFPVSINFRECDYPRYLLP